MFCIIVTYLIIMKKTITFICVLTLASTCFCQTNLDEVDKLSGPRFGVSYIGTGSTAQVLNRVNTMDSLSYANYSGSANTMTTQYGWQWETRFADTGGPVVGLVEWVALIAGMEKGLFLPSFSTLVGIRSDNGLEFATGPNLSGSGLGFVFALGYNYKKGDLNLPINIAFVPNKMGPSSNSALSDLLNSSEYFETIKEENTGYRITVSVGFNLKGSN
jgi:hypothetical protein